MKSVGIMISSTFLYKSGIGMFLKSIVDIFKLNGWAISLILNYDKDTLEKLSNIEINTEGINIYHKFGSSSTLTKHTQLFQFEEGVRYADVLNYQANLCNALEHEFFDLIICNDYESTLAAYNLGLSKFIDIMYYTHCHSIIPYSDLGNDKLDVFSFQYIQKLYNFTRIPDVLIGTQSWLNKELLGGEANIKVLPIVTDMWLNSKDQIIESSGEEAILYIGRFEPRKNTEYFIKILEKVKQREELKVNIITKKSNKVKFEKAFTGIGYTNYTIHTDVSEQEKLDIIKNSSLFLFPSKLEAYAIVVKETMPYMPCIVLDKFKWPDMWGEYVIKCNQDNIVDCIFDNIKRSDNQIDKFFTLEENDYEMWVQFLNSITPKEENLNTKVRENNLFTFLGNEKKKLNDFYSQIERDYYLSDYTTLYKNRKFLTISYEYEKKPNGFLNIKKVRHLFVEKKDK
jgi:glycosyltransferase involved in cell wall biosynthesis